MSLIPQKILSVVMAKSYFIQGTERNRTLGGRDKELHHRLGIKEGLFVIELTCIYGHHLRKSESSAIYSYLQGDTS